MRMAHFDAEMSSFSANGTFSHNFLLVLLSQTQRRYFTKEPWEMQVFL